MSSPWTRTAARMLVLSYTVNLRNAEANSSRWIHVTLRADDQLHLTVEFSVGCWVLKTYRGSSLIGKTEYGTESTARSKGRRWVEAQLKEMRPKYAAEEAKLTADFIARGYVVAR